MSLITILTINSCPSFVNESGEVHKLFSILRAAWVFRRCLPDLFP
jgi:hypothetical protein